MKYTSILVMVFLAMVPAAWSQSLSFGFGDVELEATLNELDVSAKVDIKGFTIEASAQWGLSTVQVTAALSQGLAPAEVYVAAFLANASGKSLDTVVTLYKKDKKAGWGALAKSLGIKPGSEAFKAFKTKTKASATKVKGKKK
ncbi:MAG: hypothetical protein CVV47_15650 [Spirochaetae bacterium HGW-Spirochaetae-3]|jgi:hypothetical protein|nr:MAG: hypothetical protein CVV47_15650 [Spirochaetae bacterium HGW-Spirochaetae-3]